MKVGENAPDFTLKNSDGNDWTLADFRGKTVVLIFYPADDSPVCTKQLCSVNDNWDRYSATGAEVVGISMDTVDSHKNFGSKYGFPFPLLSDEKGEVVEKYGVKSWIPGRSARAVVIIDKNGKIAYHKVQSISLFRPDDEEILKAISAAG